MRFAFKVKACAFGVLVIMITSLSIHLFTSPQGPLTLGTVSRSLNRTHRRSVRAPNAVYRRPKERTGLLHQAGRDRLHNNCLQITLGCHFRQNPYSNLRPNTNASPLFLIHAAGKVD